MLPFASEVKLASLLTRENGNVNAVVQQILDSGTNEDADQEVDGTTRVIDLTDEESAEERFGSHPSAEPGQDSRRH